MTARSAVERSAASADGAAYVADALRDGLDAGEIRVLTVPAPGADPASIVDHAAPTALFWSMPGGAVHAGLGAAATVRGGGEERFEAVREAAAGLWRRVRVVPHPGVPAVPPRLFGGFSFLPAPSAAEWREFGDARFDLPRLLLTRDADGARLSVAVTAEELDRRGPDAVAADVARVLDSLERPTVPEPRPALERGPRQGAAGRESAATGQASAADRASAAADRQEWGRAVASIQRRIEAGVGEKIVAARSRSVALPALPDLPSILRRLDRESNTAARFLFRFGAAAFVGATPERLVGRTGREVRTEALAGTVPAGSPEREARLLASVKDSVEHEYVVTAIAEALGPLCDRLDYPDDPRIQRLRHVVHLQTPFVGRLREPVHVLDLVARLHPTPAVGGWPRGPALEWIQAEEPGSRGWYAAPVGWFDRDGDGEFGVALRSGLIRDGRARLYAGAGIVRDSDAEAEFEETEVKLRTMLDALGPDS